MKYLFLSVLVQMILASTSFAANNIQLVHNGGEIRFSRAFNEPTFVSFYDYLTINLAQNGLQVTHQSKPTKITYKFDLDGATFYNVFPKAVMTIRIEKGSIWFAKTFSCAPDINDGGNVTIKEKCANKTAKKIISLLKNDGF